MSHLLHLHRLILNTSFNNLLALVLSFHILFLVFVDPLHILCHLLITWCDHVSILVLHHVLLHVLLAHALLFHGLSTCLLFLEQCHVQLLK